MYEYKAKVLKVVDGDTLDLEIDLGFEVVTLQRVRLYGVDTPEKFGKSKRRGLKVKKWVEDRLLGHDVVIRTRKDRRGKFGRYLVTVVLPFNLNKTLVERGMAVEYYGGRRKKKKNLL